MTAELNSEILHEVFQKRAVNTHKGDYGRVLLIGGNKYLGGAILMAASASVDSGAGLTTVATDATNIGPLHARTPEAMALDWADTVALAEQLEKSDVILVGPGMGTDEFAVQLLKTVLFGVTAKQILVVDGSAITMMAEHNLSFPLNTFTIATPHQGEWERLSNVMIKYQEDIPEMTELQRQNLNIDVLVLKKYHTQVISNDRHVELRIGGPFQATGGMGDTLAGMIAGFVGQFPEPRRATEAAVYAHSAIAEQLAGHNWVVKPSFVSSFIPNFIASIQTNL